jgi:hypothetical protein
MDTTVAPEHEIIRHLRGIRRVVINTCHGGFSLSHEAIVRYHELQGQTIHWRTTDYADVLMYHTDLNDPEASPWSDQSISRDDPYLVRVVQEMGGEAAGGPAAMLKVVEIPESVAWHIQDYDGLEWVAENHRTWS